MSVDNDDDWLHALAGRTVRSSSDAAQGARLRAALQTLPADAIGTEPATSMAREERLLAMARRAGLLPEVIARRRSSTGWWALAASVAAVSIAVLWWPQENAPVEVERGVASGVRTLAVADPAAAQAALLAELRQVGVTARGYQMLGRFGVDADLPPTPGEALRTVLRRRGLAAPPDGSLQVEFVAATSP